VIVSGVIGRSIDDARHHEDAAPETSWGSVKNGALIYFPPKLPSGLSVQQHGLKHYRNHQNPNLCSGLLLHLSASRIYPLTISAVACLLCSWMT
jgi:hypothetical protein